MNETPYKLNKEQQKLPKVERIVSETIEGEQVQKQIFADGSYIYGFNQGSTIYRYFPDSSFVRAYLYEKVDSDYILREVEDPHYRVIQRYYDNGQCEMEDRGTRVTHWYENGQKKSESSYYYEDPGINFRVQNGGIEWYENGRLAHIWLDCGFEEKYNEEGDLTYHMTHGVEDTVKYLAIRKVAERQAEKSEKMRKQAEARGETPKRAVVKKLNPIQKAIAIKKAKKELSK